MPHFYAENVKVNFDTEKKYYQIYRTSDSTQDRKGIFDMYLPNVGYQVNAEFVYWDQKNKFIELKNSDHSKDFVFKAIDGGYNVVPGIELHCKAAFYELADSKMTVKGIDTLQIANILIVPKGQDMIIHEKGDIEELHNVDMIMNAKTKYHRFSDATLKIVSHDKLVGEAQLDFVNNVSDTFNAKFFDFSIREIKTKGSDELNYVTTGIGQIEDQQPIHIIDGVLFRGYCFVEDSLPSLFFDGVITLDIDRKDNIWINFKDVVKNFSASLFIDESSTGWLNAELLQNGVYMDARHRKPYVRFMETDTFTRYDVSFI